MKDLHILLLGAPEVRYRDKTLDIQRRIPRALLFFLASQGRSVGRDEILPLFWEDESEGYARRRLTDSLSRLRSELPDPDLLQADTSLVGLDYDRIHVDQLAFVDLVERAGRITWHTPDNDPLPDPVYKALHQAVDLWRSPRFLAGANLPNSPALETWLTRTTQRMEHLYKRVLERLAHHARVTGDLEQALVWSHLALALDELDEGMHYLAIRLLIDLGRYIAAREHYHQTEKLYKREYNANPSARMVELFGEIRSSLDRNLDPEPALDWKIHSTVNIPFVGRRSILDNLQRRYMRGSSAIIFGESGQGKTRLMKEFSAKINPLPRVLLAACRPTESSLPYQPFIEVMRNAISPKEWNALPAVWVSQLSLLLPELLSLRSDIERPVLLTAPDVAPRQVHSQILEAIRQVFLLTSRDQRLLFCMDDVHWSDEASLATIAYLLERPPFDRQAFFLATARWEEENPRLQSIITSLQHSHRISIIQLTRLSDQEISELARHVIGYSPSESVTRILSSETGGNPFFLLESLRAWVENGQLEEINRTMYVPSTQNVSNLIAARLAKLSPCARSVLETAAIIRTDFSPELIALATDKSLGEVSSAIAELIKHQLVETADPSPENLTFRFVHEKIKETLLEQIAPLQAHQLHGAVARALERKQPSPDQYALLAQHFDLAGEAERAFDCWVRAGRRARQLLSTADAGTIFSRAEKIIARSNQITDQQIHSLYSEWSEMAFEGEDIFTIQRLNRDLLELGKERNSPLLIGTALDGLSDACLVSNQFEDGLAYTNQALPYLERGENLYKRMEALNHRGVFLYMLNRVEESIETFQTSLAMGAESIDPQVSRARANAHYQIAVARTLDGWPEIAQIHAQRSLTDFTILNRAHGQITAYSALAISHYFLGKYMEARSECQAGFELATRAQAWRMLGYLHNYRSMIDAASGEIDEAVDHANHAIALGERYKHPEITSAGYRLIGDLFIWLRSPQNAIEPFQQAVLASQDQFLSTDSQFRLGGALVLSGQVDSGLKMVEESLAFTERSGLGIINIQAKSALMVLKRYLGDWEGLHSTAEQLYQEATRRSVPSIRMYAAVMLGEIALREGNLELAMGYLQGSANLAAQLPHVWVKIQALVTLHQAARRAGWPDQPYRLQIEAILTKIGASVHKEPFVQAFGTYKETVLRSLAYGDNLTTPV
jgi:DNA-binding SARP family transcriptional activator